MNIEIKKEELKTMYDTRQSFYKKAYVEYYIEWNEFHSRIEKIKLYSYNTLICIIEYVDNENRFYNIYNEGLISQTSLRHLKEFLLQFFYCKKKNIDKKDILKKCATQYNIIKDTF